MKDRSEVAADYASRVMRAYQGEVYGEDLYNALADAMTNPEHALKWRVLAELEVMTKAHMKAVVERAGLSTDADPAALAEAAAHTSKYASLAWPELMRVFSDELDSVIDEYRALEADALDGDRTALHILTEHEVVTKEFCERELRGDTVTSLDPVRALIARGQALLA